MSSPLDELQAPVQKGLYIEDIDRDIFRAPQNLLWRPTAARGVFGGQVIGQSLVAAQKTVDASFQVHSLHCNFLRAGQTVNTIYKVERLRDGRSFATRGVHAIQDGKVIFVANVSFHKKEASILSHADKMPNAPAPESLKSLEDHVVDLLDDDRLPHHQVPLLQKRLAEEVKIEMRPCHPHDPFVPEHRDPYQLFWMRAVGKLADDPAIHRCVAAFMSDFALLRTGLLPYPQAKVAMIASLDHTIWFHEPFRADEWMLYEIQSTWGGGGRSLCFGKLFTRDGALAVSTAQEGVIRTAPPKKGKL